MAPRVGSRYSYTFGVRDEFGRLYSTDREPYRFYPHTDNRIHRVVEGNSLWGLAGTYFAPLPRACGYWWAIADYQPDPIIDPTLTLEPGRTLVIPSLRVLTDIILSETHLREGG